MNFSNKFEKKLYENKRNKNIFQKRTYTYNYLFASVSKPNIITNITNKFLQNVTTRLRFELRIEAVEFRILGAAVLEFREFTLASPRSERLRRVALHGARGVGLEFFHLSARKGRTMFLGRAFYIAVNLLRVTVRVTSGRFVARRVFHWHGSITNVAAFEVRILARYFGVPAIHVRAVHHGDSIAETRLQSTSRKRRSFRANQHNIVRRSSSSIIVSHVH